MDFDSPSAAQKAVTALKASGVQAQMAKVRVLPLVYSSEGLVQFKAPRGFKNHEVDGQGPSAGLGDYIWSKTVWARPPVSTPWRLEEDGVQNLWQVALSTLFFSSSIISRQEGPQTSSLAPAVSPSPPWPLTSIPDSRW